MKPNYYYLPFLLCSLLYVHQDVWGQDCNGTCFDLYNERGEVIPGTSCQPDFKPQTIGGSTCLGDDKCIIFDNTFQVNPPETLYIFAWGDGVIDTLTHQELLNLPEEEDFIGRFRRYCHSYEQVTCPDPTATFTVDIDLLNPNGECTNSAASGEIKVLSPVDVQFEVPEFICTNTPFTITNTSIEGYNNDCTTAAHYEWDFNNDGTTDEEQDGKQLITHPGFTTTGTKTITLTGYQNPRNTCGPDTETKTITVLSIPEPKFTIGEGDELTTVEGCSEENVFTFIPTSNACIDVTLPLENITENRNETTTFLWSVTPVSGAGFENSDLTLDNNVINFTEPGEYQVRLTVEDNCADGLVGNDASCITVIVKDVPEITIDTSPFLCEGGDLVTIILSDGNPLEEGNAQDIQWEVVATSGGPVPTFDGTLESLIIENMPVGSYELSLTYENICGIAETTPVIVEVQAATPLVLSVDNPSVCLDDAFTLSVDDNAAESYSWFENDVELTGANKPSLSRQFGSPGEHTYYAEVARNGCLITSNTVTVTIASAPSSGPIQASQNLFCPDEEIDFSLEIPNVTPPTADMQWQTCTICDGSDWFDIEGATNAIFSGTNTGSYRVQIDAAGGCITVSDPINIEVTPLATFTLGNTEPTTCAGEPLTLALQGGASRYSWTPAEGLSTNEGGTVVATLTTDTEFTVTAETAAGCSRDTTFTVRVLPAPEIQLAASESVVCPGDPVALRATQGTTYEWLSRPTLTVSPDDPAIATALPEVTTTYQVVGTNEQGCRDTAEVKIEVRTMPGVSSSDTAVCISSEPFLLSLQLPAGVSGTWSGEGLPPGSITPNGQFNPQVAGLSPNGHAVTFAYQTDDAFACSSSISLNVIVNPLPELSFDLPDVVCVNQPITLTNTTADDERLTYRWEVEGTEYTDRSPVHHFQQTAEATTIWLFTETPEGCIASTPRTIQVVEAPEPSFTKSVEPESLCGPLSVTFANESKGDLITYLWDFGNGETSTEANPGTIIFEPSVLGDTTYAVTLSVTNACTTLEFVDSVHVRPPPIANFLFEKDTICADYPIRIHNHSLGLAETYVWDFGLDNPILPLGANQEGTFRQAFPNPGDSDTTYLVTLTATNSCGTDQITRPLVVTPKTIEAFYNSNTTRGCGPLEVELTSNQERTGNQVMFVWGDGDTTQGPAVATHIYENPGIYYPKMIAQNGCNIDACGGPGDPDCGVAIVVYPTPIADFNADEQICISEELELINTSSDAVNSTWDLGDGRTFVGTQPPPFTYSQPGDYTITLTTTNQQGCRSAEKTRMVSVRPLPKPDFAISANPYCQADDVVIQNMSIGASAYQWKVDGLGVISTDQDLNYSFSAAGVYELTMVAFNGTEENSCSDQLTRTIRVSRQAEPGFYYTRTFGCGGDSVIFTNNTRYPLPEDGVFEWDFGNGETYSGSGSVPPQLYLYPPQGTVASYNVTLTVHTEGCDSVFRQTIDVNSAAGVVLPEGDKPLAFTPTALNNNQFRLNYVQVTDIDLRIFSREGVEVFQTHDPGEAWDGYYRGELAPAGLYNVQVAYQDCTGGRGSTSLQLYLILEDF